MAQENLSAIHLLKKCSGGKIDNNDTDKARTVVQDIETPLKEAILEKEALYMILINAK